MAEAGTSSSREASIYLTPAREVETVKPAEQPRCRSAASAITAYEIALNIRLDARHGKAQDTHIVPHDRALLPRTKIFVADAIDGRVSARLAARRHEVGIDHGLLDLLLDVPNGTVERLETGQSRIAPSRLFRLARILEVPIDWFFDEAQSETPPAEPVSSRDGAERQAEARRFLALYARIADPNARAEIREMVRSLAVANSRPVAPKPSASILVRTGEQRRSA